MNLFLDDFRMPEMAGTYCTDVRYRTENWYIVRNYKEFCKYIKDNGLPTLVSFDHDLADEHYAMAGENQDTFKEKTGYECALWLCDYCWERKLPLPEWLIHSMNPVGWDRIYGVLKNYEEHYEKWEKDTGNRSGTTSSTTEDSI